jgi:feruloyl esterase
MDMARALPQAFADISEQSVGGRVMVGKSWGMLGLLALAAALFGGSAQAADPCAALAGLTLEDTTLAVESAPGGFVHPASIYDILARPRPAVRGFCRVQGIIHGRIRFEVWLPAPDAWNRRLQGVGDGGMAGATPYPALLQAVEAGYAAVGSDLGHQSDFIDSSWAVGHPERVRDWGHRATHEMTVRAKAIVAAYYGHPAQWSYFTGCSGGGRQAMSEAQRYPQDYDGIVAGDPTLDFVRLTTAGRLWMAQALGAPDVRLTAAKLRIAEEAAIAECDHLDGVSDAVIDDPSACRFDPARLGCGPGPERVDCLTPAQVAALRRIYAGAADSKGQPLFPGYERGGESGFGLGQMAYASGFLRGMAFDDPSYDPQRFDFDADIARIAGRDLGGETLSQAIDATSPDLRAFRRRGGKLIHYHGWNDPGVPPRSSLAYYQRVMQQQGRAQTLDFYRLFMVPGLGHCFGGRGATSFDMLPALQAWVEQGRAPQSIPAARIQNGQVVRTRILCPYPSHAVYDGKGDADRAESFACAAGPAADLQAPAGAPHAPSG